MYNRKETILLPIFLKRLIHMRFDFKHLYSTNYIFTPLMVGCEKNHGYHHDYYIRIVLLFPHHYNLNPLCKQHINDFVSDLGFYYGLSFRCYVYSVHEFYREGEMVQFRNNYDNVITSPEIVK